MISHGHGDHVLGLPSLIGCRNSARGDRKKPLEIYYPHTDRLVESVRDFCNVRNHGLRYDVEWIPIMPGYSVDIGNNQQIISFETKHQKKGITLGYKIVEKRHKLRPEYVGANIPELLRGGTVSRDDLKFWYEASTFAYCLDAFYVDERHIKNCELVVMDCTFIDAGDREDDTHYSLREAFDAAISADAKQMIAAHFSPRYMYPDIKNAVSKLNDWAYNNLKDSVKRPFVIPVFHNQVTDI